jgi:hypothetical protein
MGNRAQQGRAHPQEPQWQSENIIIVDDYNPFPPRPKGMHHKTWRLKALDRRLLGEAENSLAFEAMQRFGVTV